MSQVQRRLHQQNRGLLAGIKGNRILAGIARRIWIDPGTESGRAQAGTGELKGFILSDRLALATRWY